MDSCKRRIFQKIKRNAKVGTLYNNETYYAWQWEFGTFRIITKLSYPTWVLPIFKINTYKSKDKQNFRVLILY